MTQQTDNLQDSSPDVETAVTGNDASVNEPGDFFADLDRQVNGATFDDAVVQTQTTSEVPSPDANVTQAGDEVSNLEKRYADSSREAKRLHERNKELETYAPLLDRMREDPQLISTIRNYIEGGGKTGIKERLGVSEDFVFDSDEAFSDPQSDSARVFNSVVDNKVKQLVGQQMSQKASKENQIQKMRDFREKHSMDEKQFDEFMNFAQSRPLNYEDIYYLMTRESRDSNIASETRKEVANQMQGVRQRPQSLAGSGANSQSGTEQSAEDAIFDTMVKEGLENLWNQE